MHIDDRVINRLQSPRADRGVLQYEDVFLNFRWKTTTTDRPIITCVCHRYCPGVRG